MKAELDFELIAGLLEKGDYMSLEQELQGKDLNVLATGKFEGISLLYLATYLGDPQAVEMMLRLGADAQTGNVDGRLPIHHAAALGEIAIIELLVEYGADLNALDEDGWHALHWAVQEGDLSALEWLVEKGVDVLILDREGKGLLHHAAPNEHLRIIRYLVEECKLDLNKQDGDGLTPVMWSVLYEQEQAAAYFIDRNCDLRIRDNEGKSGLDYIHSFGSKALLDKLN